MKFKIYHLINTASTGNETHKRFWVAPFLSGFFVGAGFIFQAMAYFSNGTEGMVFDEQCTRCKYGEDPCPITWVQHEWNYEACNNPTARAILDFLVKNDGTCAMYETFKKDFRIDTSCKEQELF